MRKLSFYVLRQIVGPFLLFTLLLTLVVWMTQSLRLLDLVINRGQSAAIFAYLTMLMLPSLLVIIVPIAFFGAALYALNKLNNDSELVVMWAAGISRLQLATAGADRGRGRDGDHLCLQPLSDAARPAR